MRLIGKRGVAYLVLPILATALSIPCHYSGWHGNMELHTLLETVATVIELITGAIALKGYYTTRKPHYLLLGSVLVGAAVLDGGHTLITSSFLAGKFRPGFDGMAAWSEVIPQISVAVLLGSLGAKNEAAARLIRRIGDMGVHVLVGISVLGGLLLWAWAPFTRGLDSRGLVPRPAELLAAMLFTLAALAQLRKGAWRTQGLEHGLVLSLIASACGHLFYQCFSAGSYDASFFGFHWLKIASCLLILGGLFSNVSSVYRGEAKAVLELRRVNETLAEEIHQRQRIEEALRRSHDELEVRVHERTADLEEQSRQVGAAHSETELFLTSIPSILIGLDAHGRVTRWNPTACETFGIAASHAMGRTLADCGVRWLHPDMRAEVSCWLRTNELYRCDELTYETEDGVRALGLSIRPIPSTQEEAARFLITGADVTERKKFEAALSQLAAIVQSCDAAIIGADLAGKIQSWNAAAERIYGYSLEEVKGRPVSILWPPESTQELSEVLRRLNQGESIENIESIRVRKGGKRIPVMISFSPVRDGAGKTVGACSIATDITERKLLERQLAQAQKLESIGQLAAGIAHEINTPIQYVGDNIRFLQDSFGQLDQLLEGYDRLVQSVRSASPGASFLADIEALAQATRVKYLRAEIPKSIADSLDGAGRVGEIVRAMKEFSYPGSTEKTPLDINRAIESTVLVSRNEWKYVADLEMELEPDLPPVLCVPGEFNQVILNLIVNGAHAIADVVSGQTGTKGRITVSTARDGEWVEIRVRDTGTGIPDEFQSSIFNPFFTTKAVGKGTGQGLAIAHSVIVQKHGGTISFETARGRGTAFQIRIPIGAGTRGDAPSSIGSPLQPGCGR